MHSCLEGLYFVLVRNFLKNVQEIFDKIRINFQKLSGENFLTQNPTYQYNILIVSKYVSEMIHNIHVWWLNSAYSLVQNIDSTVHTIHGTTTKCFTWNRLQITEETITNICSKESGKLTN